MAINSQRGIDTVLVAAAAGSTSARTANLDCRDASYATIRINFGIELNTNATGPTLSLLHSDDTVVTNFATVTANVGGTDDYLEAAKEVRYEVDLRGKKRYLRLTITPATTTNDPVTCSAIATLTRNITDPGSTTDMGDDEVIIV